jgi:excisionase family DNA binding protein
MNDQILTVKEVAEYFKVNERTVYRLAIRKEIPAFRVGASWRFKREEIDEWVTRQDEPEALAGRDKL